MSILNTSVSGMQGNSNWLSSISQNVANSNTTGYKNVETDFSSLVDQIANGEADFGGVSTSQVSRNGLQGSVISTSTPTDLAVQGAGFFVVSDSSGTLYLTRNGSFTPDASGNLVNSAGYYLMAANVQNGVSPLAANSLTDLVKVNVVNAGQTATPTTTASLTANLPSTATPVARRQLAVRQFGKLDLYRGDVACRVRQSRRLAHDQSLLHQHRVQHLGGRRVRRLEQRPPAAAFPIRQGRSRRRPWASIQPTARCPRAPRSRLRCRTGRR